MTKYLYQGTRDGLVDALASLISEKMLDGDWGNTQEIAADVEIFLKRNEDTVSSVVNRVKIASVQVDRSTGEVVSSYDTKSNEPEAKYKVPVEKHPPVSHPGLWESKY